MCFGLRDVRLKTGSASNGRTFRLADTNALAHAQCGASFGGGHTPGHNVSAEIFN